MKYLLLLIPFYSFCQKSKIDSTTNEFYIDSVISITGNKQEIFDKEKLWITKVLGVPNNSNQIIDNDLKMLSTVGTFDFTAYYYEVKKKEIVKSSSRHLYKGRIKIKLFSKDGKAKIAVSGYEYQKNFLYPSDFRFYTLSVYAISESQKYADSRDKELRVYPFDLEEVKLSIENYINALIKNFAESLNKKADNDF